MGPNNESNDCASKECLNTDPNDCATNECLNTKTDSGRISIWRGKMLVSGVRCASVGVRCASVG